MTIVIKKSIWFIERIVIGMLALSVLIIAAQVFFRYVLNSPITWAEQAARYLFVWMIFLGIPILFHRSKPLTFDLLLSSFSARTKVIIETVIRILICIFAGFYFTYSLNLCMITGGKLVAGIEIPYNYVYSAQPIAAFLLFFVSLDQMRLLLKESKRKGGNV